MKSFDAYSIISYSTATEVLLAAATTSTFGGLPTKCFIFIFNLLYFLLFLFIFNIIFETLIAQAAVIFQIVTHKRCGELCAQSDQADICNRHRTNVKLRRLQSKLGHLIAGKIVCNWSSNNKNRNNNESG